MSFNILKVVGGMTWCISVCDFDIDVDLLFQENSTIGQKMWVPQRPLSIIHFITELTLSNVGRNQVFSAYILLFVDSECKISIYSLCLKIHTFTPKSSQGFNVMYTYVCQIKFRLKFLT